MSQIDEAWRIQGFSQNVMYNGLRGDDTYMTSDDNASLEEHGSEQMLDGRFVLLLQPSHVSS